MSNSVKKDKELEKIDEDQAYFELCQIIAEAIQTQDINLLNARIAEWKRKYPWDKFSKNLKAKIDYILNQYYSELIQYIIKSIKDQDEKKEFNQSKALLQLYRIIKKTNDLKTLKQEASKWKSKYPIDSFMKMYAKKAKLYTSEQYLKENAFDQEKAFYDLYYALRTNNTFEELKEKTTNWEKTYSIGDKFTTDDFVKHESDIKHLLDEEYLNSISTDRSENNFSAGTTSLSKQQSAYDALLVALSTSDNSKVFDWVYKNKDISFNSFYRNQILVKTAFRYPISALASNPKLGLNLNNSALSFDEFQNIDSSRRFIILKFIESLTNEHPVPGETFQSVFKKSEIAKHSSFTEPALEKELEVETKPKLEEQFESVPVIENENNKPLTEDISINNKTDKIDTPDILEEISLEETSQEDIQTPISTGIEDETKIETEVEITPEPEEAINISDETACQKPQKIKETPEIFVMEITPAEKGFAAIKKLVLEDEITKEDMFETEIIPVEQNSKTAQVTSENTPKQKATEEFESVETKVVMPEEEPTNDKLNVEPIEDKKEEEQSTQIEFSDTPLFEIVTEDEVVENVVVKGEEIEEDSQEEISTGFSIFDDTSVEDDPFDLIYKKSQLAKATIIVEDTIDEEIETTKKSPFQNFFTFKNRNKEENQ